MYKHSESINNVSTSSQQIVVQSHVKLFSLNPSINALLKCLGKYTSHMAGLNHIIKGKRVIGLSKIRVQWTRHMLCQSWVGVLQGLLAWWWSNSKGERRGWRGCRVLGERAMLRRGWRGRDAGSTRNKLRSLLPRGRRVRDCCRQHWSPATVSRMKGSLLMGAGGE